MGLFARGKRGRYVGASPVVALRSGTACPGAALLDPNFHTIPSVSPRHCRWKHPPSCSAPFLSCHLLSPEKLRPPAVAAVAVPRRQSPQRRRERQLRVGAKPGESRGWSCSKSAPLDPGWIQQQSSVSIRDLIQVNKSPGLLPLDPGQSLPAALGVLRAPTIEQQGLKAGRSPRSP